MVQFRYPYAITKNLDYVSPQVVLELGTHAEFVPDDRFYDPSRSPPKNFRMLLWMETLPSSPCSRSVNLLGESNNSSCREYYRPTDKEQSPGRYSRLLL